MINFLYGTDRYRIKEREREIIAQLLVNDQTNLDKLEGENITYSDFDRAISRTSLFGGVKVVLIRDLLSNKDKDIKAKIAEKISNKIGIDLIIVQNGEPDKREKLFKTLIKIAKTVVFAPLSEYEVKRWILDRVEKSGIKISNSGIEALYLAVGADLNRLSNEIEKLSLYAKSRGGAEIDQNSVTVMVKSAYDPNIFNFIESIALKNRKQSIRILTQFIDRGEDEIKLFSMVVYQYRILITIADLLQRGVSSQNIASQAKLNPYVVTKTLPIVKKYSIAELIKYYRFLLQTDLKIKTGQIEPKVAMDLVVVGL